MIKRILSIILFCIVSNLAIAQVKVAILPVADKSGMLAARFDPLCENRNIIRRNFK